MSVNVLFLCTHNSARSIIAETVLNNIGKGHFKAYSAGSSPRENQQPHPMALQVLQTAGYSTLGARSKSWDEFATADAPPMDLIITVCDNAAGEQCPHWPGRPASAHWGYPDPSELQGTAEQRQEAFMLTMQTIRRRLEKLVNLPADRLHPLNLEQSARELANLS